MENRKSASKEDYLKIIFELSYEQKIKVTTSNLSENLSVSPAAVTDMIKKLVNEGFTVKNKSDGVLLSEKGKGVALNVLRKHRLWETFLADVLGLSWTEVHIEAEQLEHKTSDFLIDKIDEYLQFPKIDPHGTVIPTKDGKLLVNPDVIKLSGAENGLDYRITRIYDKDSELIKYFDKIKLKIESIITIKEKLSFDDSLVVLIDGKEQHLSKKVSDYIFVEKC